MLENITLKHGKILIPNKFVNNQVKFMFKGLKWSNHTKNYWYIYATKGLIDQTNKLFNIKLDPKEEEYYYQDKILFKTPPYEHQLKATKAGYMRDGFGYLLDPGLGKSKIIVDEAQTHAMNGDITGALVICTKSMIGGWVQEIRTHGYSEDWRIMRWPEGVIQEGAGGLSWLIINIDAITSPEIKGEIRPSKGFEAAYNFILSHEAMMVVDESTTIKNHAAKRSKAAMKIRAQAKYRRILTGTPIANTPMDLYNQLYFLDPECVNGWSYYAFRNHFCTMGGFKNKQIIGYINQSELATMVSNCCFKADKEACLDLPPKIYQERLIPMSKETRKLYNEIAFQLTTDFAAIQPDDEGVLQYVEIAITKMSKLRQLTGGNVIDNEERLIKGGNEKLDELEQIMNEGPGQIIIWCQFDHEIKAINELLSKLNVSCGWIYGKLTGAQRDTVIANFEKGIIDAIIVQNDTGSESITLNAANTVIYFTNSFSHKTRMQSEDRCHRIGQTKSVTYIDLLVDKSIDVTVRNLLKAKKSLANLIMDAIQKKQNLNDIIFGG